MEMNSKDGMRGIPWVPFHTISPLRGIGEAAPEGQGGGSDLNGQGRLRAPHHKKAVPVPGRGSLGEGGVQKHHTHTQKKRKHRYNYMHVGGLHET